MRSRTDTLLLNLYWVLTDPDRTDAEKVALANAQVRLIVARRKAARMQRRMSWLAREWAAGFPDHDPESRKDSPR